MTTFKIKKNDKGAFKGTFAVWQNCDFITHVCATGIEITIFNDFVKVALTVGKKKKTEIVKFYVRADEGNSLKIDKTAKKYVTMKEYFADATPLIKEDGEN